MTEIVSHFANQHPAFSVSCPAHENTAFRWTPGRHKNPGAFPCIGSKLLQVSGKHLEGNEISKIRQYPRFSSEVANETQGQQAHLYHFMEFIELAIANCFWRSLYLLSSWTETDGTRAYSAFRKSSSTTWISSVSISKPVLRLNEQEPWLKLVYFYNWVSIIEINFSFNGMKTKIYSFRPRLAKASGI